METKVEENKKVVQGKPTVLLTPELLERVIKYSHASTWKHLIKINSEFRDLCYHFLPVDGHYRNVCSKSKSISSLIVLRHPVLVEKFLLNYRKADVVVTTMETLAHNKVLFERLVYNRAALGVDVACRNNYPLLWAVNMGDVVLVDTLLKTDEVDPTDMCPCLSMEGGHPEQAFISPLYLAATSSHTTLGQLLCYILRGTEEGKVWKNDPNSILLRACHLILSDSYPFTEDRKDRMTLVAIIASSVFDPSSCNNFLVACLARLGLPQLLGMVLDDERVDAKANGMLALKAAVANAISTHSSDGEQMSRYRECVHMLAVRCGYTGRRETDPVVLAVTLFDGDESFLLDLQGMTMVPYLPPPFLTPEAMEM